MYSLKISFWGWAVQGEIDGIACLFFFVLFLMYFDGMFELFVSLEDLFFIEEIFLLKGEGIVFEMGEGLAEAALIQDDGAVLY